MKKSRIIISLLVLSLTACAKDGGSKETESTLAENQKYAYAIISEITGNDMEIYWAEEKTMTMSDLRQNSAEGRENGGMESSDRANSGRGNSGMEGPNGENPGGGNSGMESPNGENPGGGSSGMENSNTENGNSTQETEEISFTTYETTGESASLRIPVGTEVYTSEGRKTTFSRLGAGDTIKLLLETGEDGTLTICSVWIME
jgi:hypothetical protein